MARVAVLAVGMLSVCACSRSIRFAADTVIEEDGRVVRSTEIASSGSGAFEALATRYDLLPGGAWTESVEEQPPAGPGAEPRRVYDRRYRLTRQFTDGEAIAGDFSRRGVLMDAAATNAISVRTRKYWFVDIYDYQETFTDIATPESATAAMRRIYAITVDLLAEEMAALTGSVSPEDARDRVSGRFDSVLEAILQYLETNCFDGSVGIEDCVESMENDADLAVVVQMLDGGEAIATELAAIFPAPEGTSAADWLGLIRRQAMGNVDRRFQGLMEGGPGEALEDEIFGAHGFALFEIYPFVLSLKLPGEIVSTNATSRESGLLQWSFEHDAFWLRELTLRASSRVVHRDRIVIAAAWIFFGAIGALLVVVSRRQRTAQD